MRPDLVVYRLAFRRRRYWGIKDPVALKYFQLGEQEYAILSMLDGRRTLEQVRQRFERAFAPCQLTLPRLQNFLARMHRSGLLVADAAGQGQELLARRRRDRRRRLGQWGNLLALRFRGFDPSPLLDWLYPKCRVLLSRWMLALAAALVAAAAILVAVHWQTFLDRLPEAGALLSAQNLVWLAVTLALVKVVHELGHAVTCRHFGAACHEMGVMFLVFTPCLYCNVTDSWMLPNRWHRMAIAAAGIGVELVLAAGATFLWWFSLPGLLHALCLNVMVVCSVGTLMFNANPLLRYDGYYLLSDLVEIPNLWEQSRSVTRRLASKWCLGLPQREQRWIEERNSVFLFCYGVASSLYRWFLVAAILWFVYRFLEGYRLQWLAQVLLATVLATICLPPLMAAGRFLRDPVRRGQTNGRHVAATLAAVALAAALVGVVPLPYRVQAPAVLRYADAAPVYVTVPGTLVEAVRVGTPVDRAAVVARLANRAVDLEAARLAGARDQLRERLRNTESRRGWDNGAAAQIPAVREALHAMQKQFEEQRRDQRRLVLQAPRAGTILPPPLRSRQAAEAGQLRFWSGLPTEERNRGCYLETGTLLCQVGDPRRLEAILYVDQRDIALVGTGQTVRIDVPELPGEILTGRVVELAKIDLKVAPRELVEALPTRTDRHGLARPLQASYRARVVLDGCPRQLLAGTQGRAKIDAARQPLLGRWLRTLSQTFHFRLE